MVVKGAKNGYMTGPPVQSSAWWLPAPTSFELGPRGPWALSPLHRLSDHPLERVDIVMVPSPSPTPSCKCLHNPPCPVSGGAFRREEHTSRCQPWPTACEHQ